MITYWIRRYFIEPQLPEVMEILSGYGTETWHRETERVKRDALIISNGSLDVLRSTIELAKQDYRDVLISEAIDKKVLAEINQYKTRTDLE